MLGTPKKGSGSSSSTTTTSGGMCVQGDSGLVLTTDPKPRLRWTAELHDRFVDAVTQLGGPDKATPKTIMRVMGVKGLTLYHLKSHLQKFRLGKQPHKDHNHDHSIKDTNRASMLDLQRNVVFSPGIISRNMNEMQMEVQRRIHEQIEVQKHLHLRIEAQGKYMQSMLEKACETQASLKGNQPLFFDIGPHHLTFPSSFHQDANAFANANSNSNDHLMPNTISDDTNICLGMKRLTNNGPYDNNNDNNNDNTTSSCGNKSSHLWFEDHFRLQHPSSCQIDDPLKDNDLSIQFGPASVDKDIDSTLDLYEMKPNFSEDARSRTACHG